MGVRLAISRVYPGDWDFPPSRARDDVTGSAPALRVLAVPNRYQHVGIIQHVLAGCLVSLIAIGGLAQLLNLIGLFEQAQKLRSRFFSFEVSDVLMLWKW